MSAIDTIEDPDRGLREWPARLCPPASTLGSPPRLSRPRAPRVGWLTTRRFSGCGARRACACRCRGAASERDPRLIFRCRRRKRQMWCGRSISNMTPPLTAVRSRSYPPSMSTPANASAASWRDPSRPSGWPTNSTTSPRVLRLDNGPEMIAAALAEWAGTRTGMLFIPPGEPWGNPFIESFNGRLRDECLNINVFWSLAHARIVIGDWQREYNHHRPHSALGYQPPACYAASCRHLTPRKIALAHFRRSTPVFGRGGAARDVYRRARRAASRTGCGPKLVPNKAH